MPSYERSTTGQILRFRAEYEKLGLIWDKDNAHNLYDIAQSAGEFISTVSENRWAAGWLSNIEDIMLAELGRDKPILILKPQADMLKSWFKVMGCDITPNYDFDQTIFVPYRIYRESE